MSQRNDGGLAFSWEWIDINSAGDERVRESGSGMSLWDYYAAHVPEVLTHNLDTVSREWAAEKVGVPVEEYKGEKHFPKILAQAVADFADAMLAERAKRFGGGNDAA